jgi:predicted ATP-grasp superfamily ATP-dependent carboligase
MVVPASDRSLCAVASHAGQLTRAGFVVAAPSADAASACLHKTDTYAIAERVGVPAPATVELESEADVEAYARRGQFPAVLKPVLSHRYYAVFGRKWTRVDSPEHALAEFRQAEAAGLEVVLQELIPGDELCGANYNAYFWQGEPLVEMTAEKVRNSPAETGSPSVVRSRELPDLLEPGRRMLAGLGFDGFANIEFKRDPRDGLYKIIEVNARHNLSAMLAYRCGINFPMLQYRHLVYGERPVQTDYREGLYWIDATRDLKEAWTYLRRCDYSVGRFLAPYLAAHVYAVWDPTDPSPARTRARDMLRRAGSALRPPSEPGGPAPGPLETWTDLPEPRAERSAALSRRSR